MRRIRLVLASSLLVEFADRETALGRIKEWADRGMATVQVVYGPEGCGKTAWLRQSAELLREMGFDVIYIDPLHQQFATHTDMADIVRRLSEAAAEAFGIAQIKLATLALEFAREALRRGKRKVAVLADDVFQAVGLDKAAQYVKGMLGLIEYPPRDYDVVIAVAATSEGITRREIGRHRWADLNAMWNMPKEGFKRLYEQIPGEKPAFEDVWRWTGGNPKLLGRLYEAGWDADKIVERLAAGRDLATFIKTLSGRERQILAEAVENPDALYTEEGMPLMEKLRELDLALDLFERKPYLWVDVPPPERDPELGIGKYVAWQTPLHMEAIRRTLENVGR
ncbi:ATP-binding protein [Pyrobaculum aerophilum]|uniref:AAA family ATPase n=1 Tax=Pyrobaculum aerophilum TaxID=13773 RepID=A0A371QVT3_9CREN|nr:ATP-binding protein [Pyrobaculum aerophilum]RFA94292.1 AAA family ATPase [Pyrobaculum aerophilum]RFA94999.1 AAA family ATPase [Pyrobaculum aerophilum]